MVVILLQHSYKCSFLSCTFPLYEFLAKQNLLVDQNFLFTSKDEDSLLKAIDFGLSDFVKPGFPWFSYTLINLVTPRLAAK